MKIKKPRDRGRRVSSLRQPPRLPVDYPWVVLKAAKFDLDSYLSVEESSLLSDIIKKKDVDRLLDLADMWGLQRINLNHWETTAEMAAVYQLSSLLKRFPFASSQEERRETAKKKFFEAEEACSEYNRSGILSLACPATEDVVDVFTYARGFISRVLGDMPDFDQVTKWSRHGPGATLSTKFGFNSLYAKYESWPYDVTKAALGYAHQLILCDERWLGALEDSYRDAMEIPKHYILDQEKFWANVFNVVDGNGVTFVPKTARTERTIAIEPTMNLMLQLGVDGYIRKRLKAFGINLDTQEKNQELARRGSIDGSFSTIDLKAASDTVSTELCRLLLPPCWYSYLMRLRSPIGVLDGEVISYEKISSMGNGYTFALESLIFASCVYGTMRHYTGRYDAEQIAVFGDDLIVPTEIAQPLIYYLRRFGFQTNIDKTFCTGFVRESCGTDWFRGHLIRPVFLDEYPTNVKQLFSARNRLKRKFEIQWYILESKIEKIFDKWCPEKLLGFIGPLSHEDFDSYRHVSYPFGIRYVNSLYKFKRLIYQPVSQKGSKFLFRKLMTTLRGTNEFRIWINKNDHVCLAGLEGGGSCFTVTRRNCVRMSVSASHTSYWYDRYDDIPIRVSHK